MTGVDAPLAINPPLHLSIHERTVVQRKHHKVGFRTSVLCATVSVMIWALMIIFGCDAVQGTDSVSPVQAAATTDTLRNCLTVAGGLRTQDQQDAAVKQVYHCYEKHFAPMEPMLRAQNEKATMSLEYGFGVLATNMNKRGGDPVSEAIQLADRVEAVIDSVQAAPSPVSAVGSTATEEIQPSGAE